MDSMITTQLSSLMAYAMQILIAGIFAYAGISKLQLQNRAYYVRAIESYGLTIGAAASMFVRALGIIEVLVALMVLLPITKHFGLVGAVVLLATYFFAFAKQIIQGKADMNCGCAGPGAEVKISSVLLLRNLVLVLICLFALSQSSVPSGASWLIVIPLGLAFGLIYSSAEQLIANQQKIKLLSNT